jgi:hypothetical protein
MRISAVAMALPLVALILSGCVQPAGKTNLSTSGLTPPMQWDVRPDGKDWTRSTLAALEQHDSVLAGAVLTPSTDPVTMLLLTGAITALYLVGVGLASLVSGLRPAEG